MRSAPDTAQAASSWAKDMQPIRTCSLAFNAASSRAMRLINSGTCTGASAPRSVQAQQTARTKHSTMHGTSVATLNSRVPTTRVRSCCGGHANSVSARLDHHLATATDLLLYLSKQALN